MWTIEIARQLVARAAMRALRITFFKAWCVQSCPTNLDISIH
jgi:hypothetical protein